MIINDNWWYRKYTHLFDYCLKACCPKLAQHKQELQLPSDIFFFQWMQCGFLNVLPISVGGLTTYLYHHILDNITLVGLFPIGWNCLLLSCVHRHLYVVTIILISSWLWGVYQSMWMDWNYTNWDEWVNCIYNIDYHLSFRKEGALGFIDYGTISYYYSYEYFIPCGYESSPPSFRKGKCLNA